MTVTTRPAPHRHLTLVPANSRQAELDRLADLDALHATACDAYDLATSDLDAARKELAEAAQRLTEAEDSWSKAVAEMDAAARAVANAREAAGQVWSASGYRRKDSR